jgi:hypothetical protein
MSKHYFNKINPTVRMLPEIDEDFSIYRITRRDVSNPFDLTAALGDYSEQIVSVRYAGAIIYVMVDHCSTLNISIMKSLFSHEDVVGVDAVRTHNIDTLTILNLLLYRYAASKFQCSGSEINGRYIQVVKSSKQECLGIACQFNGINNDIRLDANVNTFSKFHLLTEKDRKKCKGFFLFKNGTMIKKFADLPTDESVFALKQRFRGKKNSWDSFKLKTPTGDSKIDIIGDIYSYFKSCKYVSGFDFDCVEMSKYDDHKYFKSSQTYYEQFFGENAINVICPDDFDFSIFSQDCFKFIKSINRVDFPTDGLNLVLMKFTGNGENEAADEAYLQNKTSEYVCQHINVEKVAGDETGKKAAQRKQKLTSEIITALRELIIKQELKNRKIESFDWDKYCNSPISELTFCKKCVNDDDDEIFYSMTVNVHTGNITTMVDEEPEFLGDAIYYMDQSDIGIVLDNGRALILRKSEYHIVPYYKEYQEEIFKYLNGKDLTVECDELYDELIVISRERPEWAQHIEFVLSTPEIAPYVFENSNETIDISVVKKTIQKCSANQRAISDRLDKWVREEYDAAIVSHIKGQKDTVFPGLVGLHYNDNWFTVSESESSINEQPRNIKINQIEYFGEATPEFFKELLPLFYVPFVRNNMLSAKPFPFKYLDEWIEQEESRTILNKKS